MSIKNRIKASVKPFFVHLTISVFVAAIAAIFLFGIWFPYPFRDLAGGLHLFWLMIGIDVICGPVLTAILFNPKKSRRELQFDLSIVATLQIVALVYGLYSISLARPVHLAFEADRFVAVTAADIDPAQLTAAPVEYQSLSWIGPSLIGTRTSKNGQEMLESVDMSTQGIEPSARPGWWQDFELNRPQVQVRMKKLAGLRFQVSDDKKSAIDVAVKDSGQPLDQLNYLPLVSKKHLDQWIVLLDSKANIVGYAPVDGFQ